MRPFYDRVIDALEDGYEALDQLKEAAKWG